MMAARDHVRDYGANWRILDRMEGDLQATIAKMKDPDLFKRGTAQGLIRTVRQMHGLITPDEDRSAVTRRLDAICDDHYGPINTMIENGELSLDDVPAELPGTMPTAKRPMSDKDIENWLQVNSS